MISEGYQEPPPPPPPPPPENPPPPEKPPPPLLLVEGGVAAEFTDEEKPLIFPMFPWYHTGVVTCSRSKKSIQ